MGKDGHKMENKSSPKLQKLKLKFNTTKPNK